MAEKSKDFLLFLVFYFVCFVLFYLLAWLVLFFPVDTDGNYLKDGFDNKPINRKFNFMQWGLSHPTLRFVLQIWINFSRYWESCGIPLLSVHLQDYFLWMVKISSDCTSGSKEGLKRMCGKQTATDHHNSVLKELISWNNVCPYLNWELRKKPRSVVVFITKYTKKHLNYKMWLCLIECYPIAEIDSFIPVIPWSLERQITDKKWSNKTTQSFHKDEFTSLAREKHYSGNDLAGTRQYQMKKYFTL